MNQNQEKDNQKISVSELAKALSNISEIYNQPNLNPNQFFEYKQRFQSLGIESLKDIQIHKPHPKTTPLHIVEAILELSLAHPAWGCIRLSEVLKTQGIKISSPTVQSILIKHGMGNRYERIQKLEEKALQGSLELTIEQINLIEKVNPCFQQNLYQSTYPGELLAHDTIYIGFINGIGKVYAQTVIDTFGNYAFGFLHVSKLPACAVAILHNDVLPFYKKKNLKVKSILTDNGREYCGKEYHHYEMYLILNDIEHLKTEKHKPGANSFVKRFSHICQNEFFKKVFREKPYTNITTLQTDFDQWLFFYNTQRPNFNQPNSITPPINSFSEFF